MKTLFLLLGLCGSLQAAVRFDGVDDIVATAESSVCAGEIPISISVWINPSAITASADILDYFSLTVAPARGWLLSMHGSGVSGTNTVRFYVQYQLTELAKGSASQSIPSNQWTHVATTWSGVNSTNAISVYINGVLSVPFRSVTSSGSFLTDTNQVFSIGCRYNITQPFIGQITEAAVWTNELSAAEVATLATSRTARKPLMVRPCALVAYWPLDGGAEGSAITTANSIYDMSGQGRHATPTNSPTWKPSPLSYP